MSSKTTRMNDATNFQIFKKKEILLIPSRDIIFLNTRNKSLTQRSYYVQRKCSLNQTVSQCDWRFFPFCSEWKNCIFFSSKHVAFQKNVFSKWTTKYLDEKMLFFLIITKIDYEQIISIPCVFNFRKIFKQKKKFGKCNFFERDKILKKCLEHFESRFVHKIKW